MKKTLIGLIIGFVVASGIAFATIPDGNGVIHGCYKPSDGKLVLINTPSQSCGAGETELTWNQEGPQGPIGPPGTDGATGPQGPTGAAGSAAQILHSERTYEVSETGHDLFNLSQIDQAGDEVVRVLGVKASAAKAPPACSVSIQIKMNGLNVGTVPTFQTDGSQGFASGAFVVMPALSGGSQSLQFTADVSSCAPGSTLTVEVDIYIEVLTVS